MFSQGNNRLRWLRIIFVFVLCMLLFGVAGAGDRKNRHTAVGMHIQLDADEGKTTQLGFDIKLNACIKVELYAAGGTGYEWQLDEKSCAAVTVAEHYSEDVNKDSNRVGGKVRTVFILRPKAGAGSSETIVFLLRRVWEPPDMAVKVVKCNVNIRD